MFTTTAGTYSDQLNSENKANTNNKESVYEIYESRSSIIKKKVIKHNNINDIIPRNLFVKHENKDSLNSDNLNPIEKEFSNRPIAFDMISNNKENMQLLNNIDKKNVNSFLNQINFNSGGIGNSLGTGLGSKTIDSTPRINPLNSGLSNALTSQMAQMISKNREKQFL